MRAFAALCLLLALVFAPALPAQADALGPAHTFDAAAKDTINPTDYTLNPGGSTLTVTGDGTYSYTLSGLISGTGSLTKTGPGTLVLGNWFNTYTGNTTVTGGTLRIARDSSIDPDATITVSGSDSVLQTSSYFWIGNYRTGVLNITNGGKASVDSITLGVSYNSNGTATVDGEGSTLTATESLLVGGSGTGVLNITNKGKASGETIILGDDVNSSGTATVDGEGSSLTATNSLYVGQRGTGVLNITNKGTVNGTATILGADANSSGTVTVDGEGSSLILTEYWFQVGGLGTGVLDIKNKGITCAEVIFLGAQSSSKGTITVGKDSTLESNQSIYVGGNVSAVGGKGLLAGSGTVEASGLTGVLVYNTGTLSPGDTAGAIDTLNITGNLDLQNNATLHVDFNNDGNVAGTNQDHVSVTGSVALGTNLNISLSSLVAPMGNTPRTIVTAGGTMGAAPSAALLLNGLSLGGSRADGSMISLGAAGKELQITGMSLIGADNKSVTWKNSVANGDWDIATENWTDSGDIQFLDGDAVTFNNTADTTITIQGTQKTIAQMIVQGPGKLTINGNILADGALTR